MLIQLPKSARRNLLLRALALATWCAAWAANAQLPGNVANGAHLYQARCGGCHSLDANRIGPAHRGVVGRLSGTAPGFAYSPALRKLRKVWTPAALDKWLTDPQAVAPGTAMGFRLTDTAERRDVIAYLVSVSPAKK